MPFLVPLVFLVASRSLNKHREYGNYIPMCRTVGHTKTIKEQ